MKYNICGFSQEKLIEFGLDYADALILQEVKDFYATGRMVVKEIDGKDYFWVKYKMLIESLPVLGLKSRDSIYRRMMKMVKCGVLEHKTIKRNGTYSFFCFGKAMPELLWSGGAESHPTGYGSKAGRGTDEKSEQKTLLTDNPSTKDNNTVAIAPEESCGTDTVKQENKPTAKKEVDKNRKWALEQSSKLIDGVSRLLDEKLIAKPDSVPILQLLKAGVTSAEVEEMVECVIKHSDKPYFPVVKSSMALKKKWDNLQGPLRKYGASAIWVRHCPNMRGEDVDINGITYAQHLQNKKLREEQNVSTK